MTDAAIVVKGLQKEIRTGFWGKRVQLLHDVTMTVKRGSVFGFVGPNGAGKSTTIKVLLGAARPSAGDVSLLGGAPQDRSVRARTGYLPELPAMPGTLTGRDLLRLHARLSGTESAQVDKRVDELFERTDLEGRGEQRISTFSKGMQQRLLLASALLGEPELLVLDEPMSGLDPLGRRLVREVIHAQRARGATVFFSSHVLADVEALCDEVALLVRGRVRRVGRLHDVVSTRSDGWELVFVPPAAEDERVQALCGGHRVNERGSARQLLTEGPVDAFELAKALTDVGCRVLEVLDRRPTLEDELALLAEEDDT